MSIVARAALFVIKQVAGPALEKFGEHIGIATGRVVAQKIDPSFPAGVEEDEGGEDAENAEEEEGGEEESPKDPVLHRLWKATLGKPCPCGCQRRSP